MGAIRKGECPAGRNQRCFVRKRKPAPISTSVLTSARLPSGLYSLIGVKPGASRRAIKDSVAEQRRLVRVKLRSAKTSQARSGLTKRSARLDEAERVLSDASLRAQYDLQNKFLRAGTSTPRVREFRGRLNKQQTQVLASITVAGRRMKAAKKAKVRDHEVARHPGLKRRRQQILKRPPTWRSKTAWTMNKNIVVMKRARGERRRDRRKGPLVAIEL